MLPASLRQYFYQSHRSRATSAPQIRPTDPDQPRTRAPPAYVNFLSVPQIQSWLCICGTDLNWFLDLKLIKISAPQIRPASPALVQNGSAPQIQIIRLTYLLQIRPAFSPSCRSAPQIRPAPQILPTPGNSIRSFAQPHTWQSPI